MAKLLGPAIVNIRLLKSSLAPRVLPARSTSCHCKDHVQQAEPGTANITSEAACSESFISVEKLLLVYVRKQEPRVVKVGTNKALHDLVWW
jgi:hypothetical protein